MTHPIEHTTSEDSIRRQKRLTLFLQIGVLIPLVGSYLLNPNLQVMNPVSAVILLGGLEIFIAVTIWLSSNVIIDHLKRIRVTFGDTALSYQDHRSEILIPYAAITRIETHHLTTGQIFRITLIYDSHFLGINDMEHMNRLVETLKDRVSKTPCDVVQNAKRIPDSSTMMVWLVVAIAGVTVIRFYGGRSVFEMFAVLISLGLGVYVLTQKPISSALGHHRLKYDRIMGTTLLILGLLQVLSHFV
jgi:diacylglycerol kinase